MQKMVADKKFTYRARDILPGEVVEVDDEHVKVFSLIGFAHVAQQTAGRRGQRYKTRVMRASRV